MQNTLKKVEFPNQPGVMGYSSLEFYSVLKGSPRSYRRWLRRNLIDNPMAEEGRDFAISRRLNGKIEGKGTIEYILSESLAHGIALKHPGPEGDAARAFFSAALASTKTAAAPAGGDTKTVLEDIRNLALAIFKDPLDYQEAEAKASGIMARVDSLLSKVPQ